MVAPGDAFQHYFWGEKNAGYDVLLSNMKQGVTATKEFHEILRERANYEEAFSKSLRRLSDKVSTINSVGSFLPVWDVIKKYIETMSKIHGDFSSRFKDLCAELATYKTDVLSKANKPTRENSDAVKANNSLTNIKNSLDQVNKCKKIYHQRHKELVENEELLVKAGTTTDKSDKEQERIQQKFTKSQDAFTQAETAYKASVEKYNKVQEEFNDDMTNSCKYFGEVEQTHLSSAVEFAKRLGEMESELCEDLQRNCETILGGLVGYTPENLIEMFVEEKKTGVEMAPVMEPELLTTKDAPIISGTPRPLDKSSDSGSVNSLPNVNTTTVSAPAGNMNTISQVALREMKAFRKMMRTTKGMKSKAAKKSDADSKSIDSKNSRDEENGGEEEDGASVKSNSEHSGGRHSDSFDKIGHYFSSDDDLPGESDSEEDDLTAKLRTVKIKNPSSGQATEEQLRKATEGLTLSCLSPGTAHRDRSKTLNPQLFSASARLSLDGRSPNTRRAARGMSSSCNNLSLNEYGQPSTETPLSPELSNKASFPTTFNTPRAKSISGHLGSPRSTARKFPFAESNNDNAWAVFDDSFKGGSSPTKQQPAAAELPAWSTPPATKRNLFEEHKIESKSDKKQDSSNSLEGLLEFAPSSNFPSTSSDTSKDIEDLLSITIDEKRAISPGSEYMTPESSPTNQQTVEEEEEEKEEVEGEPSKNILASLIEFSPVRLGTATREEGVDDPLSSTQKSEETHDADSGIQGSGRGEDSPIDLPLSNDIDVEDSKLLSPLGSGSKGSLDRLDSIPSQSNGPMPAPLQPDIFIPASTENVAFSSQTQETVEEEREEMVYPIAIAIIETANAIFKPDDTCTSKVEGELIMSLPVEAASALSCTAEPPALKIQLSCTTPPTAFIVNRSIFSTKPPCITDVFELNMSLLQSFLSKRLEVSGPRINIPLLKYYSPVADASLVPLIASSSWAEVGTETLLSVDVSINQTIAEQNFYFPRIVFANSLSEGGTILKTTPPATEAVGNRLKWERLDVGSELAQNPDHLVAHFQSGSDPTPTHIEFEVEGALMSGTNISLVNSEYYCILTTVKKTKSGKYWTEPKVIDSHC